MKCEECEKEGTHRRDIGRCLCSDHHAKAISRLRPSQFVRRRPLPAGYFR